MWPEICTAWLFTDLYMKALKNVLLSFLFFKVAFFFFKDIWCGPLFFNVLLTLLQYCFCGLCSNFFFFFFLATRHLSSLTRDQTHTAALKGKVLTTGPPTKSLHSWWSSLMIILYWLKFIMLGDVVVQLPSHVWLFTTPWNCSTPGFRCYCPKPGSLVSTGQISFQNSRGIWDRLIAKSKVDVADKMSSKSGNLGRVLRLEESVEMVVIPRMRQTGLRKGSWWTYLSREHQWHMSRKLTSAS